MVSNFLKFSGMLFIIAFLGGGAILTLRYFNPPSDETRNRERIAQQLQELERHAQEDPYGGDTPEETLRLFIEALKRGDTDLAAKYFVLDKQQEWREDLAKIKEKNLLGEMVKDLEKYQTEKIEDKTARFFIVGPDNLSSPVVLTKLNNGQWKIETL